jgi:hypothetical protein
MSKLESNFEKISWNNIKKGQMLVISAKALLYKYLVRVTDGPSNSGKGYKFEIIVLNGGYKASIELPIFKMVNHQTGLKVMYRDVSIEIYTVNQAIQHEHSYFILGSFERFINANRY